MSNFATASAALTAALAVVDARLANTDDNTPIELYIELVDRRARIQQAIAGIGGGGAADTTATGTITTQNLVPTGVATAGSSVSIDLDSKGTATIQVTGTYTGALSAQITTDGTNWITPTNAVFKNMVTGANSVTIPSASVGIWQIEVIGHAKFRISALAAVTGTATIALRAAADTSQVSVAGVSTAANQNTGNASLTSINTKLPSDLTVTATRLLVDGSGVTQPVSGTVTVSNPTAQGLTDTQLRATAVPVSVASVPSHPVTNVGTFAVQVTSVPTTPVTGTFWQATQPVSIASLPALSAGTNAIGSITNTSFGISGTLPAFAATPTFNIGTAPNLTITNTAFTANAGTNLNTSALALESGGNLAGINTKLPASLGAKVPSASLSVTQAFAATSTLANVASSATSVTLLAANNNRKTAIIINDSTSDLYVTLNASAASTTNYSLFLAAKVGNTPSFLAINGDDYSGEIRGIWSSANGFARITEVV